MSTSTRRRTCIATSGRSATSSCGTTSACSTAVPSCRAPGNARTGGSRARTPASTTGKPAIAEDHGGESTGPLAPYWSSGEAGRLMLPQCLGCNHVFWPPAEVCPECLAGDIGWRSVEGTGTVWSVAVYHHAYTAAAAAAVPYQCVLVELDCGPRMISRFVP